MTTGCDQCGGHDFYEWYNCASCYELVSKKELASLIEQAERRAWEEARKVCLEGEQGREVGMFMQVCSTIEKCRWAYEEFNDWKKEQKS